MDKTFTKTRYRLQSVKTGKFLKMSWMLMLWVKMSHRSSERFMKKAT